MRENYFRRPWPGEKVPYVCTKCGYRFWITLGPVPSLIRCPKCRKIAIQDPSMYF